MKYFPLLILTAACLCSGCNEDSFSQIVDIEIPAHESRPVLKLEMEPGTDDLQTLVSLSKGILDEGTFEVPGDADVRMLKNGSLFADFSLSSDILKYEAFLQDDVPNDAGDVYRLEATLPGFETVYAEQEMPVMPLIAKATYEAEGTVSPDGDRVDEITVEIEDVEPGKVNYYGIRAGSQEWRIDTLTGDTIGYSWQRISLESVDPLLTYGQRYGLIFSDESFDGANFLARMYSYGEVQEGREVVVELFHLTRDAYLFNRSLNQYNESIDNPFAEPVTVHTNVVGGYGVFTLVNVAIAVAE